VGKDGSHVRIVRGFRRIQVESALGMRWHPKMNPAASLTRFILRWNGLLLAAVLVVLCGLAAGLPRLEFTFDSRVFLGDENRELADLRELDRAYATSDSLFFMVVPQEGTAFSPEMLSSLRSMTEQAWQIPHVLRIDSVVNHIHARADGPNGAEIVVAPMLPETGDIDENSAKAFRDQVQSIPALQNLFLSEDGRAYGISVRLIFNEDHPSGSTESLAFAQELITSWQSDYSGTRVFLTGSILGEATLIEAASDDLSLLVPVSFAISSIILGFLIRTLIGIVTSVAAICTGAIATLGFAGWAGIPLTAGTAISPLAVTVLMSASCVHMILSWVRARDTQSNTDAVDTMLIVNLAPVTVTNLTTATGFLCLNFAQSPPLRDMGNIVAFGLFFGLFATFVILPYGMRRQKSVKLGYPAVTAAAMSRLASFSLRWRKLWLVIFVVALVLSGIGILRIGFDDGLVRYFDDRFQFRRDADAISQTLTGLDQLQFSFHAPPTETVFSPKFLAGIERFETWMRGQDTVVAVTSVLDPLKTLNQAMNGGAPEAFRVAQTQEANAQLMMFYELSLPVGMDLNSMMNVDRTQTRVVVGLRVAHSEEIRALATHAESWLAENEPTMATRASGLSIAFARISEENNRQMLFGLASVLVLVSATMCVVLRSLRMGVISLLPNLVPAILAFGLWGFTFGYVNLGSTVVTTMTFGIVVDDTIHFLMHYLRHRRVGKTPDDAIRETFSVVGAAVIITSIGMMIGFGIMCLSGFAINQHIGALTFMVVGFALLADLLFLPAVLMAIERPK